MSDNAPDDQPRDSNNNLPPWAVWVAVGGAIFTFVVMAVSGNDSPPRKAAPASQQVNPAPAGPKEAYVVLSAGTPVCSDYRDALRITAVVNMNNDAALHSMLGRTQCDLIPNDVPLKRASVQELQNGVGTTTNSGGTFYFPLSSAEVRMLGESDITRMAIAATR